MGMTGLQILEAFVGKSGLSNVPVTNIAATDASSTQIRQLLFEVGRDLVSRKCWPQLKRTHTFTTVNGTADYALPSDYYCSVLDTAWDTTNRWKLRGPQTDSSFNNLLWGYAPISTWSSYRIFGRDTTAQFQLVPTPGDAFDMQFDYVSNAWINNSGTWSSTTITNTSTFAFDDDLLLIGLSVVWPDNKGLLYDRYQAQYEKLISNAISRWNGSFKTMLSPEQNAWLYPNISEGSWTI